MSKGDKIPYRAALPLKPAEMSDEDRRGYAEADAMEDDRDTNEDVDDDDEDDE